MKTQVSTLFNHFIVIFTKNFSFKKLRYHLLNYYFRKGPFKPKESSTFLYRNHNLLLQNSQKKSQEMNVKCCLTF